MKKTVFLIIGIVLFLVVSVIAVEAGYLRYIKINCDQAKFVIITEKEREAKEMQVYYDGMAKSRSNLENVIILVENKGVNVNELKSRLQIFNTKVDKFKNDYDKFLEKLQALSDNSCDKDKLETSSNELNQQIELLKQDSNDIKSYAPTVSEEVEKVSNEVDKLNKK